jgi:hypothetical protein
MAATAAALAYAAMAAAEWSSGASPARTGVSPARADASPARAGGSSARAPACGCGSSAPVATSSAPGSSAAPAGPARTARAAAVLAKVEGSPAGRGCAVRAICAQVEVGRGGKEVNRKEGEEEKAGRPWSPAAGDGQGRRRLGWVGKKP